MQLNEAVSRRLVELMQERGMTQYQLYMKSGVPKSTIGNLVNCAYPSMKLRIIHELCQGLEIDLSSFFTSPHNYALFMAARDLCDKTEAVTVSLLERFMDEC